MQVPGNKYLGYRSTVNLECPTSTSGCFNRPIGFFIPRNFGYLRSARFLGMRAIFTKARTSPSPMLETSPTRFVWRALVLYLAFGGTTLGHLRIFGASDPPAHACLGTDANATPSVINDKKDRNFNSPTEIHSRDAIGSRLALKTGYSSLEFQIRRAATISVVAGRVFELPLRAYLITSTTTDWMRVEARALSVRIKHTEIVPPSRCLPPLGGLNISNHAKHPEIIMKLFIWRKVSCRAHL
ncbi:hypothetical protein F4776DRAFT_659980 [Hypoxylon sp. NC0597]|nr:hypothetical protein F4776DRAFT_659980 [Hypoxylon sp. NC0597]